MVKDVVPQELPVALLTDPEMVFACRRRDFTTVFRLARRAGIYPSRIGALCGLTPSRVGEVIKGERCIAHIDVIERVADGLRIPGAMLGLAHRPWELPARIALLERPTEPERPPPAAQTTPRADLDGDLQEAEDRIPTRSTVAAIRSTVQDFWRRDDQSGGSALRPAIVGQLRYAMGLIQNAPDAVRGDLQSVSAELARLAGWAHFDTRQYSTARIYFSQALRLARDIDDRQFIANVLSSMSLQATYVDEPQDAVRLACAAQDAARDTQYTFLVLSMLHMREAFAHATLRDALSCRQAITRSHRYFDKARSDGTAPEWVRYFDETKLTVDTGIALAQLGEHKRAEPLIAEGLRRENHEQQRGRAFHAVWLATAQLRNGSLDRACDTAGLALDLASTVDSPRVAQHVADFHHQLAPYAGQPAVIGFEAKLRAALG
ncbi:hypothetical protein ACIBKX_07775 [Streptomyces sp. NPDC050658]|uniref:hypothetical protein n=1 Tax=unclassified Streptomyces TaxID=2593676 RepID=UPI003421AF42